MPSFEIQFYETNHKAIIIEASTMAVAQELFKLGEWHDDNADIIDQDIDYLDFCAVLIPDNT